MAESSLFDLSSVTAWSKAVAILGVPSIIALYLVYALTTFAIGEVPQIRQQMAAYAQTIEQHAHETKEAGVLMGQLLLRICINTAKTDDQRIQCAGRP